MAWSLKAPGGAEVERLAYSPAEVAAAFGSVARAIYRAIATGELRAARVCCGSRLLVPADEARAWVDRNLTEPRCRGRAPRVRPLADVCAGRCGRRSPSWKTRRDRAAGSEERRGGVAGALA